MTAPAIPTARTDGPPPITRRAALLKALHHVLLMASPDVAPVALISGSAGMGSSTLLRNLARTAETHRRVVWVQGLRSGGLVHSALDGGSGEHVQCESGRLHEVLAQLGSGEDLLLVVDDVHCLVAQDVEALVRWMRLPGDGRRSCALAVVDHELDARAETLLRDAPGMMRFQLEPLDDDEVRAIVESAGGVALPAEQSCHLLASIQGIPALAREVGNAVRQSVISGVSVEHAVHEASCDALARFVDHTVHRLPPALFRIALLSAAICPDGTVADACAHLGEPPGLARRHARTLTEQGLRPTTPQAQQIVRDALLAAAPLTMLSDIGLLALDHLRRVRATPQRVFQTLETFSLRHVADYLPAAVAAFEDARCHDPELAWSIADTVMRTATDADAAAWAHEAMFKHALRHDWAHTVRMATRDADALAAGLDLTIGEAPAAELALEAPHVLDSLLNVLSPNGIHDDEAHSALQRRLLAGHDVESERLRAALRSPSSSAALHACSLVVGALSGGRVEQRLERFSLQHKGCGALSVDAQVAALTATAHLAMADHDAAREWAALATLTATPDQAPSLGLAHVIWALADLRSGGLDTASEHASTARTVFTGIRAERLTTWARAVRLHIDIERHRVPGQFDAASLALSPSAHPVIVAYVEYVLARLALVRGDTAAGIQGLFGVGRGLAAAGIDNPTLLNWRPHLARVFRATGQVSLATSVEDDLVAAMMRWARRNPRAGARRADILGTRSGEVLALSCEASRTVDVAALSEAERRVVRLVVQGHSNREVAGELYLSKRTVDTHLGNVYRKLGLGSRQELTDVMAQHAGALSAADADEPVRLLG